MDNQSDRLTEMRMNRRGNGPANVGAWGRYFTCPGCNRHVSFDPNMHAHFADDLAYCERCCPDGRRCVTYRSSYGPYRRWCFGCGRPRGMSPLEAWQVEDIRAGRARSPHAQSENPFFPPGEPFAPPIPGSYRAAHCAECKDRGARDCIECGERLDYDDGGFFGGDTNFYGERIESRTKPGRKDRRYCSTRCRVRALRKRRAAEAAAE